MSIMENRRLEGREKLMKKLRQNQEFCMATTLSPDTKVWTRWHQERVLNNEMDRSPVGIKNARYEGIIREIIDPQFQPKLLDWVSSISENHKKVSKHLHILFAKELRLRKGGSLRRGRATRSFSPSLWLGSGLERYQNSCGHEGRETLQKP